MFPPRPDSSPASRQPRSRNERLGSLGPHHRCNGGCRRKRINRRNGVTEIRRRRPYLVSVFFVSPVNPLPPSSPGLKLQRPSTHTELVHLGPVPLRDGQHHVRQLRALGR